MTADELKLVYPQKGAEPEIYESYLTNNFLLQPMDGKDYKLNTQSAIEYCMSNPKWKLSVQTHKILGIR
jgi:organic radical activating enzyme